MDTTGIRAALAATLEAARFRLVLRPVEHSSSQAAPGIRSGNKKKGRIREPTGDWIVLLSAGAVLVGPDGGHIAKHITSALDREIHERMWPLVTRALETFERSRQSDHLVALEAMFKKYETAKSMVVHYEPQSQKIMPLGNGEVRFDAADWVDAEKAANKFVSEINETITTLIGPAVERLHEALSQKLRET
jgi:hypothetical protein